MKKPRQRLPLAITLIATALGAGLVPKVPGHCGTLMAVPLAWWLMGHGRVALVLGTGVVTGVGTWAAGRYCAYTGKEDNQQIVIDEVAGYLVTLFLVPRTPMNLFLGFLLFRLFDVWKPWPVRLIDRQVHGGFGVMADDLAAGVYGALSLLLLTRLIPWAWPGLSAGWPF